MSVIPNWHLPDPSSSKSKDLVALQKDVWTGLVSAVIINGGMVCGWDAYYLLLSGEGAPIRRAFRNSTDQRVFYQVTEAEPWVPASFILQYWVVDQWVNFTPGRCTFVYNGDLLETYSWSPI